MDIELSNSSFLYRGILKCKGDVTVRQNEAVVKDGAVRILPHLQGFNFHDEYFSKLGYNPFYTGKQIVLNMFSAFPLRYLHSCSLHTAFDTESPSISLHFSFKEGFCIERATQLGYHELACRRILAQMELRNVQSKGTLYFTFV